MTAYNLTKTLSIVSYGLIVLNGSMMAFPFFIYLILNMFGLGNISQILTSIIGICGLIIIINQMNKKVTFGRFYIELIAFIMLVIPLIERLLSVPINLFDYLTFKIPIILFLFLYLTSIIFLIKEFKRKSNEKKNSR